MGLHLLIRQPMQGFLPQATITCVLHDPCFFFGCVVLPYPSIKQPEPNRRAPLSLGRYIDPEREQPCSHDLSSPSPSARRRSTMSPDGPGNIRVFIRWHDQTVFAGEEVKCRITFKKVAPSQPPSNSHAKPSPQQPRQPNASSPLHPSNRAKASGLAPPAPARGHHRSSRCQSVATSSRSRNPA